MHGAGAVCMIRETERAGKRRALLSSGQGAPDTLSLNAAGDMMTIRKSLIVSHIVVCILPFLMTFFVLASAFGGLYLYAASGNHVIAESGFQFNVMTQILRTAVFHSLRHHESLSRYAWVMEITDPVATYVAVEREGTLLYSYGNEKKGRKDLDMLRKEGALDRLDGRDGNGIYSVTEEPDYRFAEKEIIGDRPCYLYIMAHHPEARTDGAIEKAVRAVIRFILAVLFAFILGTSYFLSRFIIGRILMPLKELERGAEEVRKGNLAVQLDYDRNDEFTPAIETFNVMTWRLKQSLEEKEQDEERRKELIASISHDIRTPLTSIKAYVEGLALPASVQLAFSKENEEIQWSQVPEEVSYEVYRIMQELLSNILKHSGATEIDVTLTLKRKLLTLQISNNGKNYCGDEVRGKGIGFTTIQERAKAVGGLFTTDIQDGSQKFKLEISLSI